MTVTTVCAWLYFTFTNSSSIMDWYGVTVKTWILDSECLDFHSNSTTPNLEITMKSLLHYKIGLTKTVSKSLKRRLNEIVCLKHLAQCLVCSKHPL